VSKDIAINGGWVDTLAHRKLYKHGYAVGSYAIDNDKAKYVLYRYGASQRLERIHEFDSAEELNNMVKLLLPKGE